MGQQKADGWLVDARSSSSDNDHPLQVAKQRQRWPQDERCCCKALSHVPARGARTSYQSQRAGGPEHGWWR
jgi:hypothetical protein